MARLIPSITFELSSGEKLFFELRDLVVILGKDPLLGDKILKILYALFASTPKVTEWIRENIRGVEDRENLQATYIEYMEKLINDIPLLTSKSINASVKGLYKRITIKGPAAEITYSDLGEAYWVEFDRSILNHVKVVEVFKDTYMVYIGGKPVSVLYRNDPVSFARSIVGVTGYLIGYMLGPFYLGSGNTLLKTCTIEEDTIQYRESHRIILYCIDREMPEWITMLKTPGDTKAILYVVDGLKKELSSMIRESMLSRSYIYIAELN